jgi:hypothetical protein
VEFVPAAHRKSLPYPLPDSERSYIIGSRIAAAGEGFQMNRERALEALYRAEIEFHRLARESDLSPQERAGEHSHYAIQRSYEPLLAAAAGAAREDIERLANRLLCAGDPRDVLGARDSVRELLGLKQSET